MGIDAEMFVRTMRPVTKDDIIQRSWEACALFGSDNFFVHRSGDRPQRALSIVEKWEQDGPDIQPKEGETFVQVHLWTRYWGPGYERGNLPFILTLGAWLEMKFPSGEVWYGGDSSTKFDSKARAQLLAHAASPHAVDYRMGHGMAGDPESRCEFCEAPMPASRWGREGVGFICLGCNLYRLIAVGGASTEAVGHWPDEVRASA